MFPPRRPTAEEIAAAANKGVRDLIAPNLKLLFCGINPGLYTAAVGHHFGRPGNRFWPALHAGGFTPELLAPYEKERLLELGYGITNLVNRATVRADELTKEELRQGAQRLRRKVYRYRPRFVAVVGLGAYRDGFNRPGATVGRQEETIAGVPLWVLPNPSGLNAHYRPKDLARVFRELKEAVDREV